MLYNPLTLVSYLLSATSQISRQTARRSRARTPAPQRFLPRPSRRHHVRFPAPAPPAYLWPETMGASRSSRRCSICRTTKRHSQPARLSMTSCMRGKRETSCSSATPPRAYQNRPLRVGRESRRRRPLQNCSMDFVSSASYCGRGSGTKRTGECFARACGESR